MARLLVLTFLVISTHKGIALPDSPTNVHQDEHFKTGGEVNSKLNLEKSLPSLIEAVRTSKSDVNLLKSEETPVHQSVSLPDSPVISEPQDGIDSVAFHPQTPNVTPNKRKLIPDSPIISDPQDGIDSVAFHPQTPNVSPNKRKLIPDSPVISDPQDGIDSVAFHSQTPNILPNSPEPLSQKDFTSDISEVQFDSASVQNKPQKGKSLQLEEVDIITEPRPGEEFVLYHTNAKGRSLEIPGLEEMMENKQAFHQLQDGGEKDGVESILIPQYEKIDAIPGGKSAYTIETFDTKPIEDYNSDEQIQVFSLVEPDVQTEISVVTSEPVTVKGEGINMGMEVQNEDHQSNTTMVSIKVSHSVSESRKNKLKRKFQSKYTKSSSTPNFSRFRPQKRENSLARDRLRNRKSNGWSRLRAEQTAARNTKIIPLRPLPKLKTPEELMDLETQASDKLISSNPVKSDDKDTPQSLSDLLSWKQISEAKHEEQTSNTDGYQHTSSEKDIESVETADTEDVSDILEDAFPVEAETQFVLSAEDKLFEGDEVSERFYKEDASGRILGHGESTEHSNSGVERDDETETTSPDESEEFDDSQEVTENPGFFGALEEVIRVNEAGFPTELTVPSTDNISVENETLVPEYISDALAQKDSLFDVFTPSMFESGFIPLTPKPETPSALNLLPVDYTSKDEYFPGPKGNLNDKALLPSESGRSQKTTTKIKQAPNGKFYEYEYVYYYYDDEEDLPADQYGDSIDTVVETSSNDNADNTEDNEIPGDGLFFGLSDKTSHSENNLREDVLADKGSHIEEHSATPIVLTELLSPHTATEGLVKAEFDSLSEGKVWNPSALLVNDEGTESATLSDFDQSTLISNSVVGLKLSENGFKNDELIPSSKQTQETETKKFSSTHKKGTTQSSPKVSSSRGKTNQEIKDEDIDPSLSSDRTVSSLRQRNRGGLRYNTIQRNKSSPQGTEDSSLETDGSSRRLTTSRLQSTGAPLVPTQSPRGHGAFDGEPIFNVHPFEDVSVSPERLPPETRFPPRVFQPIFEPFTNGYYETEPINSFSAIDSTSFRENFNGARFTPTSPHHNFQTLHPEIHTTPGPSFETSTHFSNIPGFGAPISPNQFFTHEKDDDRIPKKIKETSGNAHQNVGPNDQVIFNLYAFSKALDVDPATGNKQSRLPATLDPFGDDSFFNNNNEAEQFTLSPIFSTELPTTIDFNAAVESITPHLLGEVKSHVTSEKINLPDFPSGIVINDQDQPKKEEDLVPTEKATEDPSISTDSDDSLEDDEDNKETVSTGRFTTTKILTTTSVPDTTTPVVETTSNRFSSLKNRFGSQNNRLRGSGLKFARPQSEVSDKQGEIKPSRAPVSRTKPLKKEKEEHSDVALTTTRRSFTRGRQEFRTNVAAGAGKGKVNPLLLKRLRYGHRKGSDVTEEEGSVQEEVVKTEEERKEVVTSSKPAVAIRTQGSRRNPGDLSSSISSRRPLPGRRGGTKPNESTDDSKTEESKSSAEASKIATRPKPGASRLPANRKSIFAKSDSRSRLSTLLNRGKVQEDTSVEDDESKSAENLKTNQTLPSTTTSSKSKTSTEILIDDSDDLALGVTVTEEDGFKEGLQTVTEADVFISSPQSPEIHSDVATEASPVVTGEPQLVKVNLQVKDKESHEEIDSDKSDIQEVTTTQRINILNRLGGQRGPLRGQARTRIRTQETKEGESSSPKEETSSRPVRLDTSLRRRNNPRLRTSTAEPEKEKESIVAEEVEESVTVTPRRPGGLRNIPRIRPNHLSRLQSRRNNDDAVAPKEESELEGHEDVVVESVATAAGPLILAEVPSEVPHDKPELRTEQRLTLFNLLKHRTAGTSLFVRQKAVARR